MAFQALDEFIIVDDCVGDHAQYVSVRLHLLIEITGNCGQIVERPAKVLDEQSNAAVDIGDCCVGVGESGVELEIDIGRQQPFTEGARVVQVGGSSGQMIG